MIAQCAISTDHCLSVFVRMHCKAATAPSDANAQSIHRPCVSTTLKSAAYSAPSTTMIAAQLPEGAHSSGRRVRQAFNRAINRDAITDSIFSGAGARCEKSDPADDVV
jgi:ABC-type transport system substrate-binding protein